MFTDYVRKRINAAPPEKREHLVSRFRSIANGAYRLYAIYSVFVVSDNHRDDAPLPFGMFAG